MTETVYEETELICDTVPNNDYLSLINKPKINNTELKDNKSLADLGIKTEAEIDAKDTATLNSAKAYTDAEIGALDIPAKTSDLTNDSGFITSDYHDSAKLDKGTNTDAYNRSQVYTITADDNISMVPVTVNANANTIPVRDNNGNLYTETPTQAKSAANKSYVDTQGALKLDKPDTPTEKSVVTIDTDGTVGMGQYVEKSSNTANTVIYGRRLGTEKTFMIGGNNGLLADTFLSVNKATDSDIDSKSNSYKPIVPSNLDYAVKTGVTANTVTLTDAEKQSASSWILPAFTEADEGKVLGIVNGALAWTDKN